MLRPFSNIDGYSVAASDGKLGTVSDFLFDDATWMVRWLVVDVGNWLFGRKVLLPPLVLGHPDPDERRFPVRLTRQQVKDSPDIDSERPVSRQMEANVYDYYGWSPYWGTGFYMGGYGMPGFGYIDVTGIPSRSVETQRHAAPIGPARAEGDDLHLRSINAVTGYHIHANDGEIGHVEDFLADDTDWSIHYLIVDTKNWWPGKKVLISPRSVREIDWIQRQVHLDVDRQKVKGSPIYDASTTVDRNYERNFHGHYGQVVSPP